MFETIIIEILIILGSLFLLLLIFSLIQVMLTLRNLNRVIYKIKSLTESLDTNYIKIIKVLSKIFNF